MRFNLIAGFINPNITEKVIQTAKNAGATGDVIIQGKGSGITESKFLGMTIQDKTDIVLFVVEEHHPDKILKAIEEECDFNESGNGILIVLNIDKVLGLSSQIKEIRKNLEKEQL